MVDGALANCFLERVRDRDRERDSQKTVPLAFCIVKLCSELTFENFNKVDVVRQQIILHTLDDLTECFAAIASDPEVTILRHKNRLSLEYDAVQSAGVLQGVAVCVAVCCSVLHEGDLLLAALMLSCVSQMCSRQMCS